MKTVPKSLLFLFVLLLCSNNLVSQNITLSIENTTITNDGTDDYYEMDVHIETDADYIQGSGQFFLNYNETAFGPNIFASGGITYERPLTSILGSQTVAVDNYNTFVINDNISSRVSYLWQQFWSSGAIGVNNVTSTPALLVHVKMKMIDVNASTDVCFDNFSYPAFDDQFFTACGPTTFAGADCFNFPGSQIFDYQPDCSEASSCLLTTIWNGSAWSNGTPDSSMNAIINGNYDSLVTGESIDTCQVTVNLGFTLIIASGDYLNVENDIVVEGSLLVENGGSIVQVDDSAIVNNNGSITVEKITPSLNDRDFSIMGSPMSSETREGVYTAAALVRHHLTGNFTPHPQVAIDDPGAENFADDTGDNWLAHTGALTVGEGYLVKPFAIGESGGTFTTNYTQGTLNNGVVNFSTLFGDDQNDSPNVLSNPYASSVDAFVFITDNAIVDAIYYWEHINAPSNSYPGYNPNNYNMGDISMYNLSGGVAAANTGGGTQASNQFIPSGQGFGIKANAAGTVTFNNSMRLTGNNSNYRNSESIDRLYLSISNETYSLKGATLIAFTESATDGFDSNYDSKRLATPISLYSLNNDKELGIQGRAAFNEDHIIPLGFSTHVAENQEYTISIGTVEGELISQATVYLIDKELETVTNLSETDYTFTANEGHQTNRFIIIFEREILGTNQVNIETISLYPNPAQNILNISSPLIAITLVEIFDLRGRKIGVTNVNHKNSYQLDVTRLKSAVYFIKISTENGTITERIIKE